VLVEVVRVKRRRARPYLRLAITALAGFDDVAANGEADPAALGLICLGFLASRLPRRRFMDMG
jgi:hypothetical protein